MTKRNHEADQMFGFASVVLQCGKALKYKSIRQQVSSSGNASAYLDRNLVTPWQRCIQPFWSSWWELHFSGVIVAVGCWKWTYNINYLQWRSIIMLSFAKNKLIIGKRFPFAFVAVCSISSFDLVTINCILIGSRLRFFCLCITVSDVYRMPAKRNSKTNRSSE